MSIISHDLAEHHTVHFFSVAWSIPNWARRTATLTAHGLGPLFYAGALTINIPNISLALRFLLPALWVSAILRPDQHIIDGYPILFAVWKWILLPLTLLLCGFFLFEPCTASIVTPLCWTLLLIQDSIIFLQPRQVKGILFTATLFFTFGEAFL